MLTCVTIRDFAASVERRNAPHLCDKPLLIASDSWIKRVIACDERTRTAGVKVGDTIKQALYLSPDAEVIPVNHGAYQQLMQEITCALMLFTDRVEPEYQPTTTAFYLDTDDQADEIRTLLKRVFGFDSQIGIASNKFVARVASAYAENSLFVGQGDESAFLAPLPVQLLPLDKEMQRRLPLLGIDNIGQLARLPKVAVWEQFGKQGKWIHDLANGIDWRTIHPYVPPQQLHTCQQFDTPIADRPILENVLRRMVIHLHEQLNSQIARQISLIIQLDDATQLESHIEPHQPLSDIPSLVRKVEAMLAQQVIHCSVNEISLTLSGLQEPEPVQLSLFDLLEPATKSVRDYVPDWSHRYRDSDYLLADLHDYVHNIPERQFELVSVGA